MSVSRWTPFVARPEPALGSFLLVVLLLLLPGCGGGGGGGGPTAPPPPPPQGIVFTPATGGGVTISMVQVGQNATTLTLDVTATGVTDLYGVAFDLQFPSQLFDLVNSSEQPFLSQSGGTPTTLQVNEVSAGQVVVGFTRLGGVSGVSGTGALVRLTFQAKASGSGGFAFSRNQTFSPAGTLGGISWLGGSVQVTL
ncbi:MAG: cohesin domain-containing protein [Acidobacteriota bacterium]